jgi:hypothetical protein
LAHGFAPLFAPLPPGAPDNKRRTFIMKYDENDLPFSILHYKTIAFKCYKVILTPPLGVLYKKIKIAHSLHSLHLR